MNTRLVQPKPADAGLFAAADGGDALKEYLSRVGKYVPAEIIAAYLAGLPVVMGTTDATDDLRTPLLAVLLFGCLLLTPFYFKLLADDEQPRFHHYLVSSIAFVVWAYSIGGWFTDIGWYHEAVAALLLIFFSLISGLIAPTSSNA